MKTRQLTDDMLPDNAHKLVERENKRAGFEWDCFCSKYPHETWDDLSDTAKQEAMDLIDKQNQRSQFLDKRIGLI